MARYNHDVVARLRWQIARAGEKIAQPLRSGIIGRCGKPYIAEFTAQLGQELGGLWQCLIWIERVDQTAFGGRTGHKLGDTFGALATRVNGPTTSGWNRLSCQSSRVKKSTGKAFRRAVISIMEQVELGKFPAGSVGVTVCAAPDSVLRKSTISPANRL